MISSTSWMFLAQLSRFGFGAADSSLSPGDERFLQRWPSARDWQSPVSL